MNKDHIMIKDKDYIVPTYARYELAVEKGNGAVCCLGKAGFPQGY